MSASTPRRTRSSKRSDRDEDLHLSQLRRRHGRSLQSPCLHVERVSARRVPDPHRRNHRTRHATGTEEGVTRGSPSDLPTPRGNGWLRDEKLVLFRLDELAREIEQIKKREDERERRRWGDVRAVLMILAGGALSQLIAYIAGKI